MTSVYRLFQILVGICLMLQGAFVTKETQRKAKIVSNITIILIFIITVLNIFIAAIGRDYEGMPTATLNPVA